MSDPLLKAIADYRAGLAAYNATPDCVTNAIEDQVIACTYGPPMAVLNNWEEPAQSLEGAVEALRTAVDEGGYSGLLDQMLKAALGYFDRQGASHE